MIDYGYGCGDQIVALEQYDIEYYVGITDERDQALLARQRVASSSMNIELYAGDAMKPASWQSILIRSNIPRPRLFDVVLSLDSWYSVLYVFTLVIITTLAMISWYKPIKI